MAPAQILTGRRKIDFPVRWSVEIHKEMHNEKKIRLTGAQLREILLQNRKMRELLAEWPARKIMMGYEKDWDEKRRRFFDDHPPVLDDQVQEES